MTPIIHVAAAFVIAFLVHGCGGSPPAKEYSAEAIEARVVDGDTGMPLPGVNVVAGWEVKGGMEGGSVVGWVKVMEAVTDANGRFYFAAWGPVKWTKGGAIQSGSPLLIFFKSDYGRLILAQQSRSLIENAPAHMQSDWNGKTIKLAKFTGDFREYARNIGYLGILLDLLLSNDECNWRQIPSLLRALDRENIRFVEAGIPPFLGSLDYLNLSYGKNCGNLKVYVEEMGR